MAADALPDFIGDRLVSCEAVDRDRYGRTVAKCAVGAADLGGQMVRAGWARGIMSGTQAGIAGMTRTPPVVPWN